MRYELVKLSNGIIAEIGLLNRVQKESRDSILNYLGMFGNEIDELINKFYTINTQIADNGGSPVLKQLINKLYENDTLTIEFAKNTTCLMLKDNQGNLIHNQFVNKYHYYDLLEKENGFTNLIKEYARKHNLNNYVFGGSCIMITVKCFYSNGDTITTCINGTLETAKQYFLGNWFNFGDTDEKPFDDMQQCIKVELV